MGCHGEKKKKGLEPGRTAVVADLVEVAPGGVVSRELAKTAGGTVTVFAFDGGEGLSEHSAPFDALVHVLAGQLEVTIAGEPSLLAAGQAILMPADVPHALRAPVPAKMMLVMLR